ncbi:FEKKY domain-containing protein [Yeosuana sp. AK3]
MNKIFLTLILVFIFSVSKVTEKEIIAEVVFENLTNKEFTSGKFIILNSNRKIEVNKAESFKITLPEKGKYQFSFITDDFTAYTFYPKIINNRKNTITIRLMDKTELNIIDSVYTFPMNLSTNLTDEQIEKLISEGKLNFIMHALENSIPEEYVIFKEKYGIGLIKENCVIDPLSFKKATENNQMIFDYLNKKYGNEWLTKLKIKPFGIK